GAGNSYFADWWYFNPGNLIEVGSLIENSNSTDQAGTKGAIAMEYAQQFRVFLGRNGLRDSILGYDPFDHPIGMRELSTGDFSFLHPHIFILTYDEALRMVQQSQRNKGEAFPVNFADADTL